MCFDTRAAEKREGVRVLCACGLCLRRRRQHAGRTTPPTRAQHSNRQTVQGRVSESARGANRARLREVDPHGVDPSDAEVEEGPPGGDPHDVVQHNVRRVPAREHARCGVVHEVAEHGLEPELLRGGVGPHARDREEEEALAREVELREHVARRADEHRRGVRGGDLRGGWGRVRRVHAKEG